MNLRRKKMLVAGLAAMLGGFCLAAPVSAQSANELRAEFAKPSADNRPLTRWWVPGSHMTKPEIRKEILSMVNAGFGGAEVVPVAVGGEGGAQIDWGSAEWNDLISYMLQVAGENNFTIDFTMTPAWPLALPTITNVDDPAQGAQMELDGAWIDGITKENPFSGTFPQSDEAVKDAAAVNSQPVLIGVTVAKYVDKASKILDFKSAKVLKVKDGTVNFKPRDDGEYVLFAWYQHPSGNKKYGNNQIDHYSAAASKMIIDFWEQNLIPAYGNNFKHVRSLFIDSLEFETHLDWTPNLLSGFKKSRGYDLTPYLPALYDSDAIGNYMGDPAPDFTFDKNTDAVKNDYREYMTQLYIENHVKPLQEFCQRHGVKLRYQTSYGKSLETAQTALYPDIPETETLYGSDFLDFYRLQSGAAHVAGKNIYSLESAAEWTEQWNPRDPVTGEFKTRGNGDLNSGNYQQTFQDHIWHDQRAFAVGVNQVVFHGYAYNGQFGKSYVEGVKWPGFDGFSASTWSNSFGERQPNWTYASTYLDFLTRNQYVLRQGTPKVDVAIYYQSYYETIDFIGSKVLFDDGGNLEQHGYSYDFLSPAALEKLSASDFPYKALVLNSQKTLTHAAAKKLVDFAKAGIPIFIIGEVPTDTAFLKESSITGTVEKLLKMPNVIPIAEPKNLYGVLQDCGIYSDASYDRANLLANHRTGDGVEFYYLYNYDNASSYREIKDAPAVSTTVTLRGEGQPYRLDAWTGEFTPLAKFDRTDSGVTFNLELAANDSAIFALVKDSPSYPTVQTYFDAEYTPDGSLVVKDFYSYSAIRLNDWTLSVESWTKGATPTDSQKTVIDVGKISALKPWKNIPQLRNVSGIGTYRSEFDWDYDGIGAVLNFGRVSDTFELRVNGQVVPLDPISGSVDITRFIQRGTNTVEFSVASSLLNAVLKENTDDQRTADSYGLLGSVTVRPYRFVKN